MEVIKVLLSLFFVCTASAEVTTEDETSCSMVSAGLRFGEICNSENPCDGGLVCKEVSGLLIHVCRPPLPGPKQYNEDCSSSSECDIAKGLCCIVQRRHRQRPRKICAYFRDALVCIGSVAAV